MCICLPATTIIIDLSNESHFIPQKLSDVSIFLNLQAKGNNRWSHLDFCISFAHLVEYVENNRSILLQVGVSKTAVQDLHCLGITVLPYVFGHIKLLTIFVLNFEQI